MPPTVEDRLRDILEGIGDIEELLQGPAIGRALTKLFRRIQPLR